MGEQEFLTNNAKETQELAGQILKNLMAVKDRKTAAVLALKGELGGGKTTFTQGLAQALGVKEKITSPTFVILRHFNISTSKHFNNFYHIDCYRLEKPEDLAELGFEEILKEPKNLIVIEWADKVKSLIPKDAVWVEFEWMGEEERKIMVSQSNDKN